MSEQADKHINVILYKGDIAYLLRVKFEDWYISHICVVNMKLQNFPKCWTSMKVNISFSCKTSFICPLQLVLEFRMWKTLGAKLVVCVVVIC